MYSYMMPYNKMSVSDGVKAIKDGYDSTMVTDNFICVV